MTGKSLWLAGYLLAVCSLARADLFVSSVESCCVNQYNATNGAFVANLSDGTGGKTGLAFGPDGNLYAASAFHDTVSKFDPVTGAFIGTFVTAGSGGLGPPLGISFGPDGNLYVVDNGNNQILKYNGTTGAFIDVFVPPGSGGLSAPWGIAFGPDGNLYVSSTAARSPGPVPFNVGVLQYNGNTGAFLQVFTSGGPSLTPSGGPEGLTFGPDGNLYVAVNQGSGPGGIVQYNGSTGLFMSTFVAFGGGGLSSPSDVKFGPDSNLYVSDVTSSSVFQFNGSTGGFLQVFVAPGSGGLNDPWFMAFSPTQPVPAMNVSAQVRVTQTGFIRNRATDLWVATLTVSNTGAMPISGPIQVLLTNLSSNGSMQNASGTFGASPFITVTTGTLAPGAGASVVIQFTNASNGFINFTPVTYSGGLSYLFALKRAPYLLFKGGHV